MESTVTIKKAAGTSKNPSETAATPTTRQKTIILVVFLALSTLLLATILRESSFHHERDHTILPSSPTSPHSLIKNTCTKTLYPSLCFTTLSSSPASKKATHPQHLLELAIDLTVRSVNSSRSETNDLFTRQDLKLQEKNALNDCLEMLDQTLYELGQALNDLHYFPASMSFVHKSYGNLKTLLSAAMTNENTCVDGFSDIEEADPESQKGLKDYFQSLLTPISRMISNCLAMVKHLEKISREGTINGQKILLNKDPPDGFPVWMSAGDRKLMEVAPNITVDITVAGDGSGDYRTIGEAVRMVPKRSVNRFVIKIKAGLYIENVEILREKTNIMLIGDGMDSTIISGGKNFVDGFSTYTSATLTVVGGRFLARDLTIINTSSPQKHQAVALRVTSDSAFYRCNFTSYQDTLYAHSLRQLYRECTIQGTIDFIFGNAAAVFQNCLILVRKPNPGQKNMITAQGRDDPNQNTGISLQNCTIVAAPEFGDAGLGHVSTFLGRPWRNHSRTMVMKSYLGSLIHPQGWYKWNAYSRLDTVEYMEYKNTGPGSDTRRRVTWAGYIRNCSEEMAERFTVGSFLHGADDWLESTGFPIFYGP